MRHFAAGGGVSSSRLNVNSMALNGIAWGAHSIVVVLRRTAEAEVGPVIQFADGAIFTPRLGMQLDAAANSYALRYQNQSSDHDHPSMTVRTSDGWVLLAVTKDAGLATPRGHKYVYDGGTWTHSNFSTAVGNDDIGLARGWISFGEAVDEAVHLDGDIALAAVWESALSDGFLESLATAPLAEWLELGPAAVWPFTQPSRTIPVRDLTGRGSGEDNVDTDVHRYPSLIATTVVIGGPPGLDLTPPAAPVVTRFVKAAGIAVVEAIGTVPATATVAADASVIRPATADIPATATIAGAGIRITEATGTIPATATIAAAGTRIQPATGSVPATATIAAAALVIAQATGTIAATATIAADGTVIPPGPVTHLGVGNVAATATIAAAAVVVQVATATVAATATIAGSATVIKLGAASVDAAGTIQATGLRLAVVTGNVPATATIGGTALQVRVATGTVAATATISANGVVVGLVLAVGQVTAAGTIAGAAVQVKPAAGTVASTATIAGSATVETPPPVPPPRWTEGALTAAGMVEGASGGTGQVEGALVGAGIVEGSSSL